MPHPFLNEAEGRLRAGFRILLFLMICVLAYGLLIAAASRGPAWAFFRHGFGPLVLACLWLSAWGIDRRPLADYGLAPSARWWLEALFGLGLGALLAGMAFLLALAMGWIEVRSVPGTDFSALAALDAFFAFASLSMREELMHRGAVLRNLSEGLGFPAIKGRGAGIAAWTASAAIWAVFHLGNPGMGPLPALNLFLMALMLGLPLLLGGGLGLPLGLHLAWKFTAAALFGFSLSGEETGRSAIDIVQQGPAWLSGSTHGPEAGLLGSVVFLIGMAAIAAFFRVKSCRWLGIRKDWSYPGPAGSARG